MPLGRNRTNAMKMAPMARGHDSVHTLIASSSTRNVAAPTKGPKNVPAPPRSVMMTTWPDVDQWSDSIGTRSEEHTSELQSLAYLVCRLLLEKKKYPNPLVARHPRLAVPGDFILLVR